MRHRVEYLIPGSLFPESIVRDIEPRTVEAALAEAPDLAFAFVLFDVEDAPDLGPDFAVTPKRKNVSGRHYIDAEVFTAEQIEALDDGHDYGILLSNMRGNEWPALVRCRTGNWQPLDEGDRIVATQGADLAAMAYDATEQLAEPGRRP